MVVETQRALVYLQLRVYGTKNSLALAHPHVQEQTCHGAANTGWCHWTPEHDLDFNVLSFRRTGQHLYGRRFVIMGPSPQNWLSEKGAKLKHLGDED